LDPIQHDAAAGPPCRNFDESRLTGAVFLDVAKTFDAVWVKGLIYKLSV
jgi:hypothetical protein